MIGKWHLVSNPTGFDYWEVLPGQGSYYNPDLIQMDGGRKRYPGYCTDVVTDLTLDWLKNGRDSEKTVLALLSSTSHRTVTGRRRRVICSSSTIAISPSRRLSSMTMQIAQRHSPRTR